MLTQLGKRFFSMVESKTAIYIRPPIAKTKLSEKLEKYKSYELMMDESTPTQSYLIPNITKLKNEKDPSNQIQIQVTYNPDPIPPSFSEENLQELLSDFSTTNQKLAPILTPKQKCNKTDVTYRTPVIKSSVKKGALWARMLSGKSLYEAIYFLEPIINKIPKFLLQCIIRSISTLTKRNLDLHYVFIKGIITSRKHRTKKIHYGARSKMGIRFKDYIDFKILYKRRNIKDFYKDFIIGKSHHVFGSYVRECLKKKNCDLEDIIPLQWILTNEGRMQQRTLFRRKVMYKYLEYKHAGVNVPVNVIYEYMADQECEEFMDKWAHLFHPTENSNIHEELSFQKRKKLYQERLAEE